MQLTDAMNHIPPRGYITDGRWAIMLASQPVHRTDDENARMEALGYRAGDTSQPGFTVHDNHTQQATFVPFAGMWLRDIRHMVGAAARHDWEAID